jgi:hypothetical protein
MLLIKEVGSQVADITDAVKGKARKGRKKKNDKHVSLHEGVYSITAERLGLKTILLMIIY